MKNGQTCPIYRIPAEITPKGDFSEVYFPQSGSYYHLSRRAREILSTMNEKIKDKKIKEKTLEDIKEWIQEQRNRGETSPKVTSHTPCP